MRLFNRNRDIGEPWLLTESALRSIMKAAAEKGEDIRSIAKNWGDYDDATVATEIHNGVAVIPVSGVLMRQYSIWSWLFGESAYEALIKDIATAVADPAITAVVLDVDSPGGECAGCAELARHIFNMREQKPIIAYATGAMCSAAYWISAACSEVIVSPTAIVGSIGTVMSIMDYSKAHEKAGIQEIDIVSSQSPNKVPDPKTDAGRANFQGRVDALTNVFMGDVAEFRGVSFKTVSEDFGKGGVFVGAAAVEAGLADSLGSLEAIIEEFGNTKPGPVETPLAQGGTEMGMLKALAKAKAPKASAKIAAKAKAEQDDTSAEDEDEVAEDEDETAEDDQESAEDEDDTSAEEDDESAEDEDETAEDEDETAEDEEVPASGRTKAQDRQKAIIRSSEAKGRRRLAEHLAFDTSLSVAKAKAILRHSEKRTSSAKPAAKSGDFAAAMRKQGNPSIGTGKAKASEDDKAQSQLLAAMKYVNGK